MHSLAPIYVADRFPLLAELVGLLRGLDADDWNLPTLAPRWSVRDIAAHLLDSTRASRRHSSPPAR